VKYVTEVRATTGVKNVIIHTDGACIKNPGPGGYGIVISDGSRRKELSGGFRHTTNNRMEIMAAIITIESITSQSQVTVFSDSQYLVKAMSQGWVKRWQKNGWKRNKRELALNPDLWGRLLKACDSHEVEFRWVRGHSDNHENAWCDQLANKAAVFSNLPADTGYDNPLY
jgi:ribonuclease HI